MTVTNDDLRIEPTLFFVLVEPVKVSGVSKGGIILGDTARENKAVGAGKIIAIGPTAFIGVAGCDPMKYPPCDPRYSMTPRQLAGYEVGDTVLYKRYAGEDIDIKELSHYKLIPDQEIKGKVSGKFEVSKSDF